MSRRRKAVKRPTLPDPRHGSPLLSTLINAVMQSGKTERNRKLMKKKRTNSRKIKTKT